jgi:hypothetical protein
MSSTVRQENITRHNFAGTFDITEGGMALGIDSNFYAYQKGRAIDSKQVTPTDCVWMRLTRPTLGSAALIATGLTELVKNAEAAL